jgi:response regulator RpfG family c-di-GMP phosphodiesterase
MAGVRVKLSIFDPMLYNVFYTDDDPDDQEMFIDAIHEIADNVKVSTQKNGKELLNLLQTPPPVPNIVFLDLNMPIKNGYEVLTEIKNIEHARNLPVIVFTTSDHAEAVEKTRQLGARLYVTKPTSYFTLKSMLKDIMSIDWLTYVSSENTFVFRLAKAQ